MEERNSSRPDSSEHSNPNPSEEPSEDQLAEERPTEEAAERHFPVENEPLEGEPLEGETTGIIDVDRLLENYKERNEDIREALSHQLSTSGLLLTLSLGAWYFVIMDSSRIPIHAQLFSPILFALTLLLILSISFSIEAINKKITKLAISTLEDLNYTEINYRSKMWWSTVSIWTLRIAFFLILIILCAFWWECNHTNPTESLPTLAHLPGGPRADVSDFFRPHS